MTAGMIANLMLNLLIAGLLVATIGYCWVLNRRIKILQDSKSELAQLLKHFDESTQRASESIIALQTASKKIGENIQGRIEKANYMLDDLAFMVEKANRLADQMEAGFAVGRARNRVLAEEQLPGAPPPEPPAEKPPSSKEKTVASLEAVLERVTGRKSALHAANEQTAPSSRPSPRGRSRAEQELLDMLKTGIKG